MTVRPRRRPAVATPLTLRRSKPLAGPPAEDTELWHGDVVVTVVHGVAQAVVLLTAVVAAAVARSDLGAGPWPVGTASAGRYRALVRWDAAWYVHIASNGYSTRPGDLHGGARSLAFFPLEPMLVHVLSVVARVPAPL